MVVCMMKQHMVTMKHEIGNDNGTAETRADVFLDPGDVVVEVAAGELVRVRLGPISLEMPVTIARAVVAALAAERTGAVVLRG